MTGPVESLNAGAAATILAYEASLRFLPQRTE
jgi:tRNA G18 (ribose-2'-O)-methylase SpoU